MGQINTSVYEIVNIVFSNISSTDLIKEVGVSGNQIKIKVKPVAILPEIALNFTVKSQADKILILFDPVKSVMIYGFLLGKLKDNQIPGIGLFKDRLEIDLQSFLLKNVRGVKVQDIFVDSSGEVKITFCCEKE